VPISAALRQSAHLKVATVASRWQHVGDLIGSGFQPRTSRTKSERLTTCAISFFNFSSKVEKVLAER